MAIVYSPSSELPFVVVLGVVAQRPPPVKNGQQPVPLTSVQAPWPSPRHSAEHTKKQNRLICRYFNYIVLFLTSTVGISVNSLKHKTSTDAAVNSGRKSEHRFSNVFFECPYT